MVNLSGYTQRFLIGFLFLGVLLTVANSGFASEKNTDMTVASQDDGVEFQNFPQSGGRRHHSRYSYMKKETVGSFLLSGGYSTLLDYSTDLGVKGVLDYMILDDVSIGLQSSVYRTPMTLKPGGVGYRRFKSTYVGLRGSYHFVSPSFNQFDSPWDVYAGISGELGIGVETTASQEKSFVFDGHLGARYRFSGKWFVWGEAAVKSVSLGVTLAL